MRLRSNFLWPWSILLILVTAASALVATRSGCLANPACVVATILIGAATTLAGTLFLLRRRLSTVELQLRHLQRAAERMAERDFEVRVVPRANDAIGDLELAFANMSDQLGQAIDVIVAERGQLATAMEHMADGVLITDAAGEITQVNPAAAALLDRTAEQMLGRGLASAARHHQLIELWQQCKQNQVELVAAIEMGPELFVQAVITPFRNENRLGYVLILRDLTQVRDLQTIRRDFISNLSHELRTPLAALMAALETLQSGAVSDPEVEARFLERAIGEVATMGQLVEELLELSRIESGKVPLHIEAVPAQALLTEPVDRLQAVADSQQVKLKINVPQDLPEVMADTERTRQVVTNILHNAIKFSNPGGKVTVRAQLARGPGTANEVLFAVRDRGVGIDASTLPRIFERFYKSDKARTRNRGGTGLGLAISRHLVEAQGGHIWAESRPGRGTTIFFTLPVASA